MKKIALFSLGLALISFPVFAIQYSILIDAGSSGSRVHVFQYETRKNMPVIKEIFSEAIKPGLSSYEDDPNKAAESLKPLLDDASSQLQQLHVDPHSVKLRVLATAGMRLLPKLKQDAIHRSVKNYISDHYSYSIQSVETISGEMEGFYGWLDVNYLLGNFQNHSKTIGTIDMGGASTQIAFITADTSHPKNEISITLDKTHYNVFVKSFLGLGQDQALLAVESRAGAANCYPVNYKMSNGSLGNFNFASCTQLYSDIIQSYDILASILPFADQPFVAFSGAYYDLQFLNADKTPDRTIIENNIQNICSNSWEDLQHKYPDMNPERLSTGCAKTVYVDDLFFNFYQLKDHQLMVTNKINDRDIDWSLGAQLYSTANP